MDPITSILTLAASVVNKIFPDKSEADKQAFLLALNAALADSEIAKAQIKVNEVEAASPNLFVSGWRPCIGWVCALAFTWAYFLQPILTYLIIVTGHPMPALPALDMSQIMSLLFGMLGMAGLRTYEKAKQNKPQ